MKDLLKSSLPFWDSLTETEQELLINRTELRQYKKGTVLFHGGGECTGVEIVKSGQARVYINSKEGKELTLYRLLEGDVCVMSAACMIKSINFGISLLAEEDSEIAIIPRKIYQQLNDRNIYVKNFTLEIIASKFSDVMWLLEQFVFSNMGQRLAGALIEQSVLCGSKTLLITHEKLAFDLGTAREVVTRLLKQFQVDELISFSRGRIEILNEKELRQRSGDFRFSE